MNMPGLSSSPQLYFSFKELKAYPLGINLIYEQALLRPIYQIPDEIISSLEDSGTPVDYEKIYDSLNPLEKTAIFIQLNGFKSYSREIAKGSGIAIHENLILVHKQLKAYKIKFNCQCINTLRVLKIHLISLILNPNNWTEPTTFASSYLGTAIECRKQGAFAKRVSKDSLRESLVVKILKVFFVENRMEDLELQFQAILNFLADLVCTMEKIESCHLVPTAYKTFQDMINILQVCLKHPRTIFPLLIQVPKESKDKQILSSQFMQFFKELNMSYNYCGKLFQIKKATVLDSLMTRNFNRSVRNNVQFDKHLLEELNNLQKQLNHTQNYSHFFKSIKSQTLIQSTKKLEELNTVNDKEMEDLSQTFRETLSEENMQDYELNFYSIHYLIMTLKKVKISEVVDLVNEIYKILQDFKVFPINELSEFSSGSLSLIDLIFITIQKDTNELLTVVRKQLKEKGAFDEEVIFIEKIESIRFAFICLYKEICSKKHLNNLLNTSVIENYFSEFLSAAKTDSAIQMVELYKQKVNQSLDLFKAFSSYSETLNLLTCPLSRPETLTLSPREKELIKDLIVLYKRVCIFNFEDVFLTYMESQISDLLVENPKDKNLKVQFGFFQDLKKTTIKLNEELKVDYQNIPIPNQVEAILNHVINFSDCLMKYANLMNGTYAELSMFFNVYKRFKLDSECIVTPLMRYKNFNSIIKTRSSAPRLKKSVLKKPVKKADLKKTDSKAKPKLKKERASLVIQRPIQPPKHYGLEPLQSDLLAKQVYPYSNSEKMKFLLDLCYMVPLVTYQLVSSIKAPKEEVFLNKRLKEINPNLANSLKNLMVLIDTMENRLLNPVFLSRTYLLLAVSFEQVLKLLLSSLQDSTGKKALLSKNAKNDSAVNWHDLSALYALFLQCSPSIPFKLSEEQLECLDSLNSVIGVTARYQGAWSDLLCLRISQIQYLAFIESLSEQDSHTPLAKEWIGDLVGSSLERSPLATCIQKGREYLQKEQQEFVSISLDALKVLLALLDPAQMSHPIQRPLFEFNGSEQLKQLYALPRCEHLSAEFEGALSRTKNKLQEVQIVCKLDLSGLNFDLNYIKLMALNEFEHTLTFLSSLSFETIGHAEACTVLLKESILLEKIFHALLSVLIINQEEDKHLILANDKKFIYSHLIHDAWQALLPYLSDDLSQQGVNIKNVTERLKFLEPLLKQLYRYQGVSSKIQGLLNHFQFLDQIRFTLKHQMLDKVDELEQIAKTHKRDFNMESLNQTAQQIYNQHVILPCIKTLELATILLQILHDRINALI